LRYLITGGAGFIGSHLAERLLERGEKVVLLDNLSTGSMENIRHLRGIENLEYHLDGIENQHLLAELVDDADVIVHFAAAVGVKLIVESPVRTIETNVNGTQMILEAASKKKKASSAGLHFRSLREEHPGALSRGCRPRSRSHDQGPLELCGFEGARRIPGDRVLEGEETAGHCRAFLQHGRTPADRPLRYGVAEFCKTCPGK